MAVAPAEGLHALLVSRALARRLRHLRREGWLVDERRLAELDPARARRQLAAYLARLAEAVLDHPAGRDRAPADRMARLVDELLAGLAARGDDAVTADDRLDPPPRRLEALVRPRGGLADLEAPDPPRIPLDESVMLANASRDLTTHCVIQSELPSADRVDVIVAFLKWPGFRLLREAFGRLLERRPGGLRVITTTYLGATDASVLHELHRMGAEVRISWESGSTRLHAKAWIFHRDSGATTALLGSSNLSSAALLDGLEWNVRLSSLDSPLIVERMAALFEQYWESDEFERFDAERDGPRLREALRLAGRPESAATRVFLDVRPYPFQTRILDRLEAERRRGHTRNLVVAATGTGKTLVAALDWQRLRERIREAEGRELRLLYVAHRREILEQARDTFRQVLRDGGFGELLVAGHRPVRGTHVFASIQSLGPERLASIDPEFYELVVVDECHHAPAASWKRLLAHVRPRWLLGLTATPERMDGESILPWFDDRIAAEIRLRDALERQLLCPFHYFVTHDETELRGIDWSRGRRHVDRELDDIFTGNHARARRILEAVARIVDDPASMRALGFCVSIAHAEFMAQQFDAAGRGAGIPAGVIHSRTPQKERDRLVRDLEQRRINVLFTVDLFNEGVDLPSVDTVLFLRPTDSVTVFLQQFGRGLRRAPGKACLTVLDFVGNVDRSFRIDRRFQALLGGTRRQVEREIKAGFPRLPPGCSIVLDERSQKTVLRVIEENIRSLWQALQDDLRGMLERGERPDLGSFLAAAGIGLDELYAGRERCWTALRRKAGAPLPAMRDGEPDWYGLPLRLLHVDDPVRVAAWRRLLRDGPPASPAATETMLWSHLTRASKKTPGRDGRRLLQELRRHDPLVEELDELLALLADRADGLREELAPHAPLCLHARYTRAEIFPALGEPQAATSREGVVWLRDRQRLLLFVTLDKSGAGFTETTRYEDYPLSNRLFHWQSQRRTRIDSVHGKLYREHARRGVAVLLFVRDQPKTPAGLGTPFAFLGTARYRRHELGRERPMSIVWELEHDMPDWLVEQARVAG